MNDVLRLAGQPTIQGAGSLSGAARTVGLTGLFNAAIEGGGVGLTASEFAFGVGVAKFGLDVLTVAYGYAFGCPK